jgi:hypothetical protein
MVACILALSLLVLSAGTYTPAHLHAGVKSDNCAVCKASETPFITTRQAVAIWPPTSITEYLQTANFEFVAEHQARNSQSRAPPAL